MSVNRAWSVLAIVVMFLIVPKAAQASCESTPPLEVALAEATVAFVGEVVDAQFDSAEAQVRVLWIWKGGDLPDVATVVAPPEAGVSFRAGATFIVIPENTRVPFELGECSGTRMYRASGEVIPEDLKDAVGSMSGLARQPGALGSSSDDAGSSKLPIAALIGAVGLVGFGTYRLKLKNGEDSLSRTGKVSGAKTGSWRRIGGPLSWSARSGQRKVKRLKRSSKHERNDTTE